MQLRSEPIERWWPTTQSLDLVEGDIEAVAGAVGAEVARILEDEPVTGAWRSLGRLDAAFEAAPQFANVHVLLGAAHSFEVDCSLEQQFSV